MKSIQKIIFEAERLLQAHPYDIAHDLSHHKRVHETALQIAEEEGLLLNSDALKVACFWHDVVLGTKDEEENRQIHINETIKFLEELMTKEELGVNFQKTVIDAIRDHGFEKKKQLNSEGCVLFDADKLDALHPKRYRKILQAVKNKNLSKIKIFMYKQAAKLWLGTMRNRYHYETSKRIHDSRIKKLLEDKETIQVGKSIGIDIPSLIK